MPENEDADVLVISNDPLHVWICYTDVIGVSLFICFSSASELDPRALSFVLPPRLGNWDWRRNFYQGRVSELYIRA